MDINPKWPKLLQELLQSESDILNILSEMMKGERFPLLDLCSEKEHQLPYDLANLLLKSQYIDNSISTLNQLFIDCRGLTREEMSRFPMTFFLGLKLAESKLTMKQIVTTNKDKKYHIRVAFAMYKENNRMKPSSEYKFGENFLRLKVSQLDWLFSNYLETFTYQLVGIDDGCPNDPSSNDAAQSIITDELSKLEKSDNKGGWDKVSLLKLQDVIDLKIPEFDDITNTKDSRKGGSIHYGMYNAIKYKEGCDDSDKREHIFIYTDSDTSADLGESGLLLGSLLLGKDNSVSEKDTDSKMEEEEDSSTLPVFAYTDRYGAGVFDNGEIMGFFYPNYVMITLRYFFRCKLLPPLRGVLDSQCGFKAIKLDTLEEIFGKLKQRSFGFDMELFCSLDELFLSKKMTNYQFSVGVPMAWMESANESSFWEYSDSELKENYAKKHYEMVTGDIFGIYKEWFSNNENKDRVDSSWVEFVQQVKWEDYFHMSNVLYQRYRKDQSTMDMSTWSMTINEMKALLNVKLEENKDPKEKGDIPAK